MLLRRAAVVLSVVCGWCLVPAEQSLAQRLPGGVRPEHYALTITPDLMAATFRGVETIDLVLDHRSDSITLNAAEIEFTSVLAMPEKMPEDSACAKDQGAYAPDFATVSLDADKEQATLRFRCEMAPGKVKLAIEYTGRLNDKLRGFYLAKTKLRRYGVTQFEATDARRAFPSFDEPALKATFDVTLVLDAADTGISNTRIVSDKPGPVAGKHTVAFATTPKMSTYLVAWLVGDFACSEGKEDGVRIRACATPDKVGLTRFALETAKWTLHYYNKYFGIKYPMQKLDMVAIPDFEAGAMENFGCLTFRETEMLVDERDGAISAKKEVATTVAHEMAHQWFGDMVTMDWWDNVWLNEGFATWMETKAAMKWHPAWDYAEDLAVNLSEAMDLDSQPTTRAIRTRADTPGEINEMFDGIAYSKAGAVIGMVENWVGEEVFRKGVQDYLAAHLYGNATATDFWDAQTRVSGLPVDKVMRSFIEQPGVPLMTLGPGGDGTGTGRTVAVTQKRFLLSPMTTEDEARTNEQWTVPVCLKGAPCRLLMPEMKTLEVNGSGSFLYAGAGDKGYYRTNYAPEQLAAIVANAETGLTAPERIGLLSDRWALMRSGEGSVGQFLDLVVAVKRDPSADVLDSALGKVEAIEKLIATVEERDRLDAMVRREFGPVYAAMGTAGKHERFERAELRGTLFDALGEAKDPAVLAESESVTKKLFAGQKPGDSTIVDAAVALAAAKGDAEMYEKMLRVERNATDPDLKVDALHVLTRFQTPALVARTLEFAVSDEVRSQDSWTLLALMLTRRETQDQAWEFVEQNWTAISRKATINSGVRIVEAAGSFCSVERRDDVSRFFAQHPVTSGERALAKSIASIDACIALRAAHEPELRVWLDAHPER